MAVSSRWNSQWGDGIPSPSLLPDRQKNDEWSQRKIAAVFFLFSVKLLCWLWERKRNWVRRFSVESFFGARNSPRSPIKCLQYVLLQVTLGWGYPLPAEPSANRHCAPVPFKNEINKCNMEELTNSYVTCRFTFILPDWGNSSSRILSKTLFCLCFFLNGFVVFCGFFSYIALLFAYVCCSPVLIFTCTVVANSNVQRMHCLFFSHSLKVQFIMPCMS